MDRRSMATCGSMRGPSSEAPPQTAENLAANRLRFAAAQYLLAPLRGASTSPKARGKTWFIRHGLGLSTTLSDSQRRIPLEADGEIQQVAIAGDVEHRHDLANPETDLEQRRRAFVPLTT